MKYIFIILFAAIGCKEKQPKIIKDQDGKIWIIDKQGWLHANCIGGDWEHHTNIPFGYEPNGYSIHAIATDCDTMCSDSYGGISTSRWVYLQHTFDSIRYANYDGYNMRQFDSIQKGIKLIDSIGSHHQNLIK